MTCTQSTSLLLSRSRESDNSASNPVILIGLVPASNSSQDMDISAHLHWAPESQLLQPAWREGNFGSSVPLPKVHPWKCNWDSSDPGKEARSCLMWAHTLFHAYNWFSFLSDHSSISHPLLYPISSPTMNMKTFFSFKLGIKIWGNYPLAQMGINTVLTSL